MNPESFKKKPLAAAMQEVQAEDDIRQDWSDITGIEDGVAELLLTIGYSYQNMIMFLEANVQHLDDVSTVELLSKTFKNDTDVIIDELSNIRASHAGKTGTISEDDIMIGISAHEDCVGLTGKISAVILPALSELTELVQNVEQKVKDSTPKMEQVNE
jgi:hypothetical protein